MKYTEAKKILGRIDRYDLIEYIEELGEEVVLYYADSIDEMDGVLFNLPHFDRWEIVQAAYQCDIPLGDIVEAYVGAFDSDETFTQDLCKQLGEIDNIPSYIHIDWEATARDIMMDYSEHGGHYFRSM